MSADRQNTDDREAAANSRMEQEEEDEAKDTGEVELESLELADGAGRDVARRRSQTSAAVAGKKRQSSGLESSDEDPPASTPLEKIKRTSDGALRDDAATAAPKAIGQSSPQQETTNQDKRGEATAVTVGSTARSAIRTPAVTARVTAPMATKNTRSRGAQQSCSSIENKQAALRSVRGPSQSAVAEKTRGRQKEDNTIEEDIQSVCDPPIDADDLQRAGNAETEYSLLPTGRLQRALQSGKPQNLLVAIIRSHSFNVSEEGLHLWVEVLSPIDSCKNIPASLRWKGEPLLCMLDVTMTESVLGKGKSTIQRMIQDNEKFKKVGAVS
ncbi:hypothetical protein DFQ26_002164 [Actinomortierella ambigua]|nr:hypothetical protein DFQ26_002164 [Actinomortierella ambigua]